MPGVGIPSEEDRCGPCPLGAHSAVKGQACDSGMTYSCDECFTEEAYQPEFKAWLSLTSFVTSGRLLNFSVPQLVICKMGIALVPTSRDVMRIK